MNANASAWRRDEWPSLEHTVLMPQRLDEQFHDYAQQHHTAQLGMWLFLATEIMFFGAVLTAWGMYYYHYADVFEHVSRRLNWQIASLNTLVLLGSSFTMARAVYFTHHNHNRRACWLLLSTAALGCLFLVLKGYEYYDDYHTGLILGRGFNSRLWLDDEALRPQQLPQVQLCLLFYWMLTLLHGLHVVIGLVMMLVVAIGSWREIYDADFYWPLEVTGLYWHFVDVMWIFLFPLLYLLGTHG